MCTISIIPFPGRKKMSIERVEKICLEFLRSEANPLVPVSIVYEKCIEEESVRDMLTEQALLDFLRGHRDVIVVEGLDDDAPVSLNTFDRAGLIMGPRAILKSRMPTQTEMKDMFQMQLQVMRDNLMQALHYAKEKNDEDMVRKIERALENADSIGERLGDL